MFAVTADIKYVDGPLAGLTLEYKVCEPDKTHAKKLVTWLKKRKETGDLITSITKWKYAVTGNIAVRYLP